MISLIKFYQNKNITKTKIIFTVLLIGQFFIPQILGQNNFAYAASYVYVNGYPTLNGNFVDCDGNIDADPSHHTTNPNDTDPGHHLGQNCPAGSLLNSAAPTLIVQPLSPPTAPAPNSNPGPASPNAYVYINGYLTLNGNFLDCNGSIDNDSSHHTTNPNDTDPGHHLGQNCSGGSLSAQLPVSTPALPANNPLPSASSLTSNIFSAMPMFVDPNNQASVYANSIRSWDPSNASLIDKIGNQPQADWFGDWNTDVQSDVDNVVTAASNQGTLPLLVAYNIPQRDCGGYSAGSTSAAAYQAWIRAFAAGIGQRQAAVILEPDATALITCLSGSELQSRYNLLQDAVNVLKANNHTAVYIDAGHPAWISAAVMAQRLQQAGINQADGFALNVSNFYSATDNISYGQQLSAALGGKHFVIDTSRSGNGPTPDAQWCNPLGRALGPAPTANTGNSLVDAFLWVKTPGSSDGQCNGGPAAGVFWPNYAEALVNSANW